MRIGAGIAHLDGRGNHHLGHIIDRDGEALFVEFDQAVAQFFQIGGTGHAADRELVAILANDPAGGVLADARNHFGQFLQADTVGVHRHRVGQHLVLLVIPAHDCHLRYAAGSQDSRLDYPVGQGPQFHDVGGIGFNPYKEDFAHHTGLGRQNGSNPFGQTAFQGHHLLADNLTGAIDVGTPIEFHPDKGSARTGGGTHPAHIGSPVDRRLYREGHQAFHFLGGHVLGIGHDHHRRRGQIREHVDIQMPHGVIAA